MQQHMRESVRPKRAVRGCKPECCWVAAAYHTVALLVARINNSIAVEQACWDIHLF